MALREEELEGLHECGPKGYPKYCGVITLSGRKRAGKSSKRKKSYNKAKKSSFWARMYEEV